MGDVADSGKVVVLMLAAWSEPRIKDWATRATTGAGRGIVSCFALDRAASRTTDGRESSARSVEVKDHAPSGSIIAKPVSRRHREYCYYFNNSP